MLNYAQDQKEDFEKLKLLCLLVNPPLASKVFAEKNAEEQVYTTDTTMLDQIDDHVSPETKDAVTRWKSDMLDKDLDSIQRVE